MGVGIPSQEFDPLPTQRIPLCTSLRYLYLVTNPKFFNKALLALIYSNFEGERTPKKNAIFWSKLSGKSAFFQNFACGAEKLTKTGSF